MTSGRVGPAVAIAIILCASIALGSCAAGTWPDHTETVLYLGAVACCGLALLIGWWRPAPWRPRVTTVPYHLWPLRKRVMEKVYRWTHHGRVRTLVTWEGRDRR
jgi:hypothetical protein